MDTVWKESYYQPRQHIKEQRHYFANKGLSSQSYGFSSSHVWMWESDYKDSWVPKKWCFWTAALEKTLDSPLNCKEIQPVHPKGNQSWIFIGRTDAEAEALILWPSGVKELTHWERPWSWERLKAGGEGDERGWDGWMASLTQWAWVWASSGSWWRTGKPGVLQSTGSPRVGHDWATEQQKKETREASTSTQGGQHLCPGRTAHLPRAAQFIGITAHLTRPFGHTALCPPKYPSSWFLVISLG